ncbi:MAG: GNAT family N-acetyltransferase [Bacteroidales bacterium]|nr:GNAT family N-acetyltransferase [Bacteroidales bacterium]
MILGIDQIDRNQWEGLLESSSTATFFQSEACYEFYDSLSFMDPFVFAVADCGQLKGAIIGYVQKEKNPIKQFFTKRAIIPGGALLADDISGESLRELLDACKAGLRKKAIYIEMRNFNDYSAHRDVFDQCGFEYCPHLNFHINTSSMDVVQENLGKSRKRDIRTSFRDGAEIVENPTLDDVRSYYSILKNLYAMKVKTPLFPFEFFEKLFVSGLGIYRLVKVDDEIVGGTLCVAQKGKALYEWFACGKDGAFKSIFPSTVATFSGIKYAALHGFPLFDMMGAGKPSEGYGVRDFKAKFGGTLVEHGRFLHVSAPFFYSIGRLGVKLLKMAK